MYAAILSMLVCAGPVPVPDTLVVCPDDFRSALQPWLAHRRAQGHRVSLTASSSPEEIRSRIHQQARSGKLRYVLLVGDATPPSAATGSHRLSVPTRHVPAKINLHWGSEPEIATDNWYADLDEDQVPDLAVGRLTADSAQELSSMVRKILAYESTPRSGDWQRRLSFIAGVGGFGSLVDSVIETAAKKFLTDGIPAPYAMSMTYGSWRSPFCPDPRHFHEAALQRLNEGCLFWIYIGHGQRRYLDNVRVPGAAYRILDTDDVAKLRLAGGPPIAVFLACYTGAFDEPRDCLAEELLRAAEGPVAVYSGSRVTMPYAMAVMGNELMHEYFHQRRDTLGEIVLHAKRRMVETPDQNDATAGNRRLLDAIAAAISPAPDQLAAERLEHVQLFNLLGDPLLRLRQPTAVELATADFVHAGDRLTVTGRTAVGGTCRLELVCRRDRTRLRPPTRKQFDAADDVLASYAQVYKGANDRRWTVEVFRCDPGEFRRELAVPQAARGPCHVRVFIDNEDQHALGAANVLVKRPLAAGAE